ncbi:hypothetical protein NDU88_004976 [Pleurodeles waltl]|uniref:Uncharacterized protein n=1 Tax=Pleurodeles waltl TaxID=8319 RepID=A0AAV7QHI4_PLEWA|nr:hypothetical protein NDU88_004976 [Pleurodeles waltl]
MSAGLSELLANAADKLRRWALLGGSGPFPTLCSPSGVVSFSCVAPVLWAACGVLEASFKVPERSNRTARACAVGCAHLDWWSAWGSRSLKSPWLAGQRTGLRVLG